MQKLDIYGDQKRFENWKKEIQDLDEQGLTKKNSDFVVKYVLDMEIGQNVAKGSKKGSRSFRRLNTIRQKTSQILRMLQDRGIDDITKAKDKPIIEFFSEMRNGKIKTKQGETYKSVASYTKIFKSAWHWWMKVNRKQGKLILDITEDLDTKEGHPKFVYLSKENLDLMLPYLHQTEQLIFKFCFDTLIRAPTELLSLKVKDVFEKDGEVWLNIPDDISKTFGRTFNFLYCGDELLKYIEKSELKSDDYLFKFSPSVFIEKIQKVAQQLWGEKLSDARAGELFKNITLYDLRHSGAIHLRILASKNGQITLDSLRQRGGWTDFKMLNYYTKFIGLDGKIDKNALLIEEDKTKLEREVKTLKEQMKDFEVVKAQMQKISLITNEIYNNRKNAKR